MHITFLWIHFNVNRYYLHEPHSTFRIKKVITRRVRYIKRQRGRLKKRVYTVEVQLYTASQNSPKVLITCIQINCISQKRFENSWSHRVESNSFKDNENYPKKEISHNALIGVILLCEAYK